MKTYPCFISLILPLFYCLNGYSQQSFERTFPDQFYIKPLHACFINDSKVTSLFPNTSFPVIQIQVTVKY